MNPSSLSLDVVANLLKVPETEFDEPVVFESPLALSESLFALDDICFCSEEEGDGQRSADLGHLDGVHF